MQRLCTLCWLMALQGQDKSWKSADPKLWCRCLRVHLASMPRTQCASSQVTSCEFLSRKTCWVASLMAPESQLIKVLQCWQKTSWTFRDSRSTRGPVSTLRR
uniref:Putative secreted protein n=1 Tax=Ixodes scapularis TaxID=6945 RepID=A0A4D5RCT3_IXOSC